MGRATAPYRQPEEPVVICIVCGTPHRRAALICDECGCSLDARVSLAQAYAQTSQLKFHMLLAACAIVAMLLINWAFFDGGAFILFTAPVVWFGYSAFRYAAIHNGRRGR